MCVCCIRCRPKHIITIILYCPPAVRNQKKIPLQLPRLRPSAVTMMAVLQAKIRIIQWWNDNDRGESEVLEDIPVLMPLSQNLMRAAIKKPSLRDARP